MIKYLKSLFKKPTPKGPPTIEDLFERLQNLVEETSNTVNIVQDFYQPHIRYALKGYGFQPTDEQCKYAFRSLYALESLRDEIQLHIEKTRIENLTAKRQEMN